MENHYMNAGVNGFCQNLAKNYLYGFCVHRFRQNGHSCLFEKVHPGAGLKKHSIETALAYQTLT